MQYAGTVALDKSSRATGRTEGDELDKILDADMPVGTAPTEMTFTDAGGTRRTNRSKL